MTDKLPCPNCSHLVDPNSRYCESCGVDLALAAVYAEQDVFPNAPVPPSVPLSPEILVPRMGETMIERGLLLTEELQQALNYQREKSERGESILLGQALLELGMVDRETLDQVITLQILQLQKALQEANRQLEQRVQERTQELQKALERLSELNRLKANFIANISHELRTPLTHMKGYLELLAIGELGALSEHQEEAIETMQGAERRLEKLIEDLIQFSLASRGEMSLNLAPVQLDEVIRLSLLQAAPKAHMKQISLEENVTSPLPNVVIDEEKISWVISQLLDNAIKFTPEGGLVKVEASQEDGLISVAVIDTGIGMPDERIVEIFEAFHQLDGSATRNFGGTGLGLTLARRIVEAHGSQVKVKSTVGEGSRFEFTLPAAKGISIQV